MTEQPQRAVEAKASFHGVRNASTRIDVFEELSPTAAAALRAFFRGLGAPHYVDEVIVPTMELGDAQIFCSVRDRPWPPWGLGARTISAVCEVHAIAPESWAISPVLLSHDDATNVGLACALYREVLQSLAVSKTAEVCYLVAEGSMLIDHLLQSNGFSADDDVFLTEQTRYFTYRANVNELIATLGLDSVTTPDLLAQDASMELLIHNALFHLGIQAGARAELTFDRAISEIIHLPRGGHASKPGGVPGGSGTALGPDDFRDPPWEFPFVALADFLGRGRDNLIDKLVERQADFKPATVLHQGAGEPEIDVRVRKAMTLDDVDFIRDQFDANLRGALVPAVDRLGMPGFEVGRIELQVTASGDGDYYRMHRDTDAQSTRELSFVYFFHQEPRSFSGGELRLFDDRGVSERAYADNSQLLSPRQDMLVIFPSYLPHELLPVRVPSKEFADSRFTLNGWIHRR